MGVSALCAGACAGTSAGLCCATGGAMVSAMTAVLLSIDGSRMRATRLPAPKHRAAALKQRPRLYDLASEERGSNGRTKALRVGGERSAAARLSRQGVGRARARRPRAVGDSDARRLPGGALLADNPAQARGV